MLDALTSEEFLLSLGTHSTAESLRRCLLKSKYVQEIRAALLRGELNEEAIQRFLGTIMPDFRRGTAFPHEMALSALAVALESRNTPFAEEYLVDLAGSSVIELAMCRRVAGLSAKAWLRQPNVKKIDGPRPAAYQPQNRIANYYRLRAVAGEPRSPAKSDTGPFTVH